MLRTDAAGLAGQLKRLGPKRRKNAHGTRATHARCAGLDRSPDPSRRKRRPARLKHALLAPLPRQHRRIDHEPTPFIRLRGVGAIPDLRPFRQLPDPRLGLPRLLDAHERRHRCCVTRELAFGAGRKPPPKAHPADPVRRPAVDEGNAAWPERVLRSRSRRQDRRRHRAVKRSTAPTRARKRRRAHPKRRHLGGAPFEDPFGSARRRANLGEANAKLLPGSPRTAGTRLIPAGRPGTDDHQQERCDFTPTKPHGRNIPLEPVHRTASPPPPRTPIRARER